MYVCVLSYPSCPFFLYCPCDFVFYVEILLLITVWGDVIFVLKSSTCSWFIKDDIGDQNYIHFDKFLWSVHECCLVTCEPNVHFLIQFLVCLSILISMWHTFVSFLWWAAFGCFIFYWMHHAPWSVRCSCRIVFWVQAVSVVSSWQYETLLVAVAG